MGYQNIDLASGFSFFTATFKGIGSSSIDLQSITSVQTDGSAWKTSGKSATKCAGDIIVQKIGTDGSYLDAYAYFSTKETPGWYGNSGATYAEGVTLAEGEGIIVNNIHTVGAKLVVNGEVQLTPARILPSGFSFCGNFTPVAIDLQDITSTQTDGSEWKTSGKSATKCAGDIIIQKIGTDGSYLTAYAYFSTKEPAGWYANSGADYVAKDTVTFAPGEGFIVNNSHSVGARLVLPSPIGE